MEELEFQLLGRKDVSILCSLHMQFEALGLGVSWGNRASGATCGGAGYGFLPFSGESDVLIL